MKKFTDLYEAVFTAPSKNEKEENSRKYHISQLMSIIKPDNLQEVSKGVYYYGGDIIFRHFKLNSLDFLPFKLEKVLGDFKFANSELTSLENFPLKVSGTVDIQKSFKLKSLKGCSQIINGNFNCTSCTSLISLEGGPKQVNGCYICNDTAISDLKGAPKEIRNGYFECSFNTLTSLEGIPSYIGGHFFCYHNKGNLKLSEELIRKHSVIKGKVYIW